MLEAAVRENSESEKVINEIYCNFSSSSRAAQVELPSLWEGIPAAVRSQVILPEQRRQVRVKLLVKMSRGLTIGIL